MKILVVDDEIMQLKGIKIGLRTEGHVVVTALSAEEALTSMLSYALALLLRNFPN